MKRLVRGRDGSLCRLCGNVGVHAHHVRYRSEGGSHDERNLITLCLACHDVVHSDKGRWKPILVMMLDVYYEQKRFIGPAEAERLVSARR